MRFAIVTDTSSNLPTPLLEQNSVTVIPFNYIIDGQEYQFDSNGHCVQTMIGMAKTYGRNRTEVSDL